MKFRIKYADRIVGLFILVAALGLAAGVVLLGANQRWFAKDYHFATVFPSAAGISPGTAILLKGFQVGKIERLRLRADNQVEADFAIYDTYIDKAKLNSVLELAVSPIGLGTQLLFHPGLSEELLEPGSLVPLLSSPEGETLVELGLVEPAAKDDTITRLIGSVGPLLENVNKTVVTVNRTLTEVNRALAGQSSGPLGGIVADAAGAVGDARGAIGDLRGAIGDARGIVTTTGETIELTKKRIDELTGRLASLLERVDSLSASLGQVADNVEAATAAMRDPTGLVPRLLDPKGSVATFLDDKGALYARVEGSLEKVERTLDRVESMAASLQSQMPAVAAALDEARGAIKQGQDVLTGLKNNPLLRGGIPEKKEQEAIYRSLREGSF